MSCDRIGIETHFANGRCEINGAYLKHRLYGSFRTQQRPFRPVSGHASDQPGVVLPRFGGHLKNGTMMCLEVFYVEEKTV